MLMPTARPQHQVIIPSLHCQEVVAEMLQPTMMMNRAITYRARLRSCQWPPDLYQMRRSRAVALTVHQSRLLLQAAE